VRQAAHPSEILIVEDQPELVRALRINLRARHYEVLTARTGREALAVAASHPPDAIILDLGLPDIDGTEVIVELRRWCRAPIIVLSGRTSPGDKIGALDVGADDYVTKPFAMAELLARLRAALRRDEGELGRDRPHQVTIGHWLVDLTAHQIRPVAADPGSGSGDVALAEGAGGEGAGGEGAGGEGAGGEGAVGEGAVGEGAGGEGAVALAVGGAAGDGSLALTEGDEGATLRLTPTEWRILTILLDRPGQLVASTQILTRVWGPGFQQRTNYLRFHMARLRRKLEDNPSRPRHLLTEPGMGYRYQP
jgi:two-component system KDP operon response regulator KdpE